MAIPSSVQTASGATSSAAPASVAPSWVASGVGTLLVVVFASAPSGAPTISTPAGWAAGPVVLQGTATALHVFYLINNAGGVTTATFNLTNINGTAWGMYELAGANTVQPLDPFATFSGSNASSTTPASSQAYTPRYTDEFWLSAVACISTSTVTLANTGGRAAPWTAGPTSASTVGATNSRLALAHQFQGEAPLPAQAAATLSGAVSWCCLQLCFYSTSSHQLILGESGAYAQAF